MQKMSALEMLNISGTMHLTINASISFHKLVYPLTKDKESKQQRITSIRKELK